MTNALHEVEEAVEEAFEDVVEALSEEELISHSRHKRLQKVFLLVRNIAVFAAALLFVLAMLHVWKKSTLMALAYFLGALAYLGEILMLTDCLTRKVPPNEMFMAYCFGPLYILLGISYLVN